MSSNQNDLQHFLKLANAQVHHRMKRIDDATPINGFVTKAQGEEMRSLRLLEDLIKEQGQANEDSRTSAGTTR